MYKILMSNISIKSSNQLNYSLSIFFFYCLSEKKKKITPLICNPITQIVKFSNNSKENKAFKYFSFIERSLSPFLACASLEFFCLIELMRQFEKWYLLVPGSFSFFLNHWV